MCSGVGILLLVGILTPIREELPEALFLLLIPVAGLGSMAFGMASLVRSRGQPASSTSVAAGVALIAGALLLLAFPILIGASIWSTFG